MTAARARLVVAVALLAMLGLPAAWLLKDVRGRDLAFPAGSAQDTSAEGALLARQYLERERGERGGPPVALLHGELDRADLPQDAVLFRFAFRPGSLAGILAGEDEARDDDGEDVDEGEDVDPVVAARDRKNDAEAGDGAPRGARPAEPLRALAGDDATLRFVHDGGRLVLGVSVGSPELPMVELPAGTGLARVHPAWAPIDDIAPPQPRGFQLAAIPGAHAIFAHGRHAAIARIPFGRGEVIALACPEILLNESLPEADHLALLERLAGERPAWFDEHVHGSEGESGVMPLLRRAGLGPLMLLGALFAAALFWRHAVRIGEPEDPHRERRSEAVDFVESVALLYERSLSRGEILQMYRRALEHEVSLREGLSGDRLHRRMASLLGSEGSVTNERELQQGLARINAAFRRLDDDRRRSTHPSRA